MTMRFENLEPTYADTLDRTEVALGSAYGSLLAIGNMIDRLANRIHMDRHVAIAGEMQSHLSHLTYVRDTLISRAQSEVFQRARTDVVIFTLCEIRRELDSVSVMFRDDTYAIAGIDDKHMSDEWARAMANLRRDVDRVATEFVHMRARIERYTHTN